MLTTMLICMVQIHLRKQQQALLPLWKSKSSWKTLAMYTKPQVVCDKLLPSNAGIEAYDPNHVVSGRGNHDRGDRRLRWGACVPAWLPAGRARDMRQIWVRQVGELNNSCLLPLCVSCNHRGLPQDCVHRGRGDGRLRPHRQTVGVRALRRRRP